MLLLNSPTNIAVSNLTATGMRVTLDATVSGTTFAVIRFTPKVYANFSLTVEERLASGDNPDNHSIDLTFSSDDFANLMRGVSYNLFIAVRRDDDGAQSQFVQHSSTVKIPFPILSVSTLSSAFSISTVSVPGLFMLDYIFSTDEIPYKGTSVSFPKIVLHGRFNYCKLVNTTTGAQIGIEGRVAPGQIRVLQTDPRHPQNGLYGGSDEENLSDKVEELTDESDISRFVLLPENLLVRPLAIEVYFFNRDSYTTFSLSYSTRYYGI